MAVSKRLRYEILRRDDYACRYCGGRAPDVALTVDHVTPESLGGTDDPDNLVAACADCNAGKSSSAPDAPLVENVADDALRWAKAMDRAAGIERKSKDRVKPLIEAVDARWRNWHSGDEKEPLPRPADWRTNVANFAAQGLSEAELIEAIEITMGARGVYNSNLWRYFCGVCWRKIRDRQEIARALLEAEEE